MKLPVVGTDRSVKGALAAPALDPLLEALRSATTLQAIGESLRAIASELEPAVQSQAIGPALTFALDARPAGLRPLMADLGAERSVTLFLGKATPAEAHLQAARAKSEVLALDPSADLAIAVHHFQEFDTGDPFVFLGVPPDAKQGRKGQPLELKNRTCVVVQGDPETSGANQPFDLPTCIAEALFVAYAAKENGAKKSVVVLPESLNPKTHPDDALAALIPRLTKASGIDELHYSRDLDGPPRLDGQTTKELRLGLPAKGPKSEGAPAALAVLAAASSLGEIQKALGRLDLVIAGLSGDYAANAKALAEQAAETLTERVRALVPSVPSGVAEVHPSRTLVFAGQSDPDLPAALAGALSAELGEKAVHFEGRTPYAEIKTAVVDRKVVVVQTTRQDPALAKEAKNSSMALLVEALMLCDQAKKAGASEVTLVLPYMPNARSDKKDQKGVGAYASLVARWIDALELGKVVLVEPHDIHVPAFFRTRTAVVSGSELLGRHVAARIGTHDLVLVSPDDGAVKRTKQLATDLELTLVKGQKSRADNSGTSAKVDSLGDKSDVEGKRVLVIDDEIATGGTMRQSVTKLTEMGATEVHVAVSHANMPLDPEKRHQAIRALKAAGATRLYLLDTQPLGRLPEDLRSFVEVVSAASAIATEVR